MEFLLQHHLAVFLLIQISLVDSACNLTPKIEFPEGKKESKRLDGLAVVNTTAETAIKCFAKCVENCKCESINVCGKTCQLNSGNQEDGTTSDKSDCTYYELSWEQQSSGTHGICTQDEEKSCCNTDNPCMNGGSCIEQCPTSSSKRYRCVCPQSTTGEHCEIVYANDCRLIYDLNPEVQSGVYTLYDNAGNTFPAFCDFSLFDGMVWTLLQSFSLGNIGIYQKTKLRENNPRNIDNPTSWEDYRLSKEKFQSIQSSTTHQRYTCNYNNQPVDDMIDYVRMKHEVVDFLTYNTDDVSLADRCLMTEYLDIRGTSCTDCTISFIQSSVYNVYTCPTCNSHPGCDFVYPGGAGAPNEENFGGFDYVNAEHRCSSSSTSTTNFWYGS